MKVALAFEGVQVVFLDTAPVIYQVEANPRYSAVVNDVFLRIESGKLLAVTSPITLSEVLILPIRQGNLPLASLYQRVITMARNTRFHPVGENVARKAAELRVKYRLELADAIQLAVALEADCSGFLTNDRELERVAEIKVLLIDDLEL